MAARLRQATTIAFVWITGRLQMGVLEMFEQATYEHQ